MQEPHHKNVNKTAIPHAKCAYINVLCTLYTSRHTHHTHTDIYIHSDETHSNVSFKR